jgi:Flp pilus assembly protein TadD
MPPHSTHKFLGASAIAAALLISTPMAGLLAAGGGGGGGGGLSPSQSTPRYDPAEEYRFGVTALEEGNYKGAERHFKRATKGDRRNANAHYLLGVTYMRSGDFKKASRSLAKAVKFKPDMVPAHRDLAIAYANIGKKDKAQKVLADLQGMKADCAGNCANAAAIDQAIAQASGAVNGTAQNTNFGPDASKLLQANSGDAAYSAAVALINNGDYGMALVSLDKAALAFGPHPDILTYQGFANRKLGRFETAEGYYSRALAIAPDHLGAWEYYGELKVERGDMNGAKEHLAKLESLCSFGCYEADELRRWIDTADLAQAALRGEPSA